MNRTSLIVAAGMVLAGCGVAGAQAQNMAKLGQKNDWAIYSYKDDKGKVCYTLTVPTDKQPPTLDHGKSMFFVVTPKPGGKDTFEPQFNASYNLQENSKVEVTVDGKTFQMFTRGNRAWMDNTADEPALIAAMRAGSDMKVAAKSGRGNPTSYVFSLKGISAALKDISACK
jgi:invasion protein IalB